MALRDTLLEDADQTMQALPHALVASERAQADIPHAGPETPLSQEGATLQYEQDLGQRVCTSLTEVCTLLEDIEESERQRGLSQSHCRQDQPPERSPRMEPRKRTHLVNELMQEAHLMMGALEKAMEGQRVDESHPTLHGAHHPQGQYSLEDEHKSWGKVLRALTDMQTELDQIERSEHQRIEP